MLRQFLLLLVVGLVFPVSANLKGRVDEATIIHESGEQAGHSSAARPELQAARSGGSTSSGDRPVAGSQRPLAPPQASKIQSGIFTSQTQMMTADKRQTDGAYNIPVRHLTHVPAPPQRVVYHARAAASATPAGYQESPPGTSSALLPASYQLGSVLSASHSQAFPGSSAGQETAVPRFQQEIAGPPATSIQSSPITSSHVGTPTQTVNIAQPVDRGQINDPPTPPSLNTNPVADLPANSPSQPGK
ncbi:hypothetical protein PtA15_12A523 [Puccinia triticina]|uniref:Uncharacterized protein n=1 Tax=Puccinia triticina TaxID=208348 RepID=A0ABY7CYZ5_9BASI|nr:uncharacterized protein PtA15_12A523 [Puccinia triticina]WAQ90533.1 hypothetical protein PtA15_12A523 [Puccinia triticina]